MKKTIQVPWITNEFLSICVSRETSIATNNIEILSYHTTNACGSADNFVSSLLRVNVCYKTENNHNETSYIVKTIDESSRFKNFVSLEELFVREAFMYETVIRNLEKTWKSVGEDVKFAPKCYGVFEEPIKIIVLEDLKNFTTKKKQEGILVDDVKVVLHKLAKMHAASMIYLEQQSLICDLLSYGLFDEHHSGKWRQNQYDTFYSSFVEAVSSWDGFEEETKLISSWKHNILEIGGSSLKFNANSINVICHGDLWTNNIMFNSHEALLVDFQFSCVRSPAQDLLFFLTSSLTEDDRVEQFDDLLRFYFEKLSLSLERLKFANKIQALECFEEDIKRRWFACAFLMVFQLVVLLQDETIQMSLALQEDNEGKMYRRRLFSNSKYQVSVQKFIKFLHKKGALMPLDLKE